MVVRDVQDLHLIIANRDLDLKKDALVHLVLVITEVKKLLSSIAAKDLHIKEDVQALLSIIETVNHPDISRRTTILATIKETKNSVWTSLLRICKTVPMTRSSARELNARKSTSKEIITETTRREMVVSSTIDLATLKKWLKTEL